MCLTSLPLSQESAAVTPQGLRRRPQTLQTPLVEWESDILLGVCMCVVGVQD